MLITSQPFHPSASLLLSSTATTRMMKQESNSTAVAASTSYQRKSVNGNHGHQVIRYTPGAATGTTMTTTLGPRLTSRRQSLEMEQTSTQKNACRFRRQPFRFYVVVDFEATCEENCPDFENEIIEFPLVLLKVDQRKQTIVIVDQLRLFIKPTVHPQLTTFCTQLTGITQDNVDSGIELSDAFSRVHHWLFQHGLVTADQMSDFMPNQFKHYEQVKTALDKLPFTFITDGPYDFYGFLHRECERKNITKPIYYSRWVNIRKSFYDTYQTKGFSLLGMLSHLNMSFVGNHHSGLDDSTNIGHIAIRIVEDGGKLEVNDNVHEHSHTLRLQPFNVLVILDASTTNLSASALNMANLEPHGDEFCVTIDSTFVECENHDEKECESQELSQFAANMNDALKLLSKWLRKHNLVKSRYPNRSKKNSPAILTTAFAFKDETSFEALKSMCCTEQTTFPKFLNRWVNLSAQAKEHIQKNGLTEIDTYNKDQTPIENYVRMSKEMLNKGALLCIVNTSMKKSI